MSRMWYAVVSTADWRYVMKIVVAPDVQHVAEAAFKVMKNTVSEKKDAVLGLATGRKENSNEKMLGLWRNEA